MAVAIESWDQVLGSTDEETAALILKLEIEDAEEAAGELAASSLGDDFSCAKELWARELKAYQATRAPPPLQVTSHVPSQGPAVQVPSAPRCTIVLFDCIICQDRVTADDSWQVPCGHYYCDGCLNDMFRVAMTDEQAYPPRCCRQTVVFEDVQHVLNRELANQFAAKKEELDDRRPTYCHVPTCSTYIGQDSKDGETAVCPQCGVGTCVLCKQYMHEGDCETDEAIQETVRLAESQGWKRCPQCERIVELRIGCNHMTCLCKAQFCYVCRATPWKTCACPQFDEARLYERAQEIVNRDGGGNAAAVAEGLREHHECLNGNHMWAYIEGENDCEDCGDTLRRFIYRCRRCQSPAV